MTRRQIITVRLVLTIMLPFALVWFFVAKLLSGIGSAFYYAWREVRINVDSYRELMQQETLTNGGNHDGNQWRNQPDKIDRAGRGSGRER
jgi:hypothetical protein